MVNHNLPVEIAVKAKKSGVSQFIFMSTAAVFGSKSIIINKDTKPEPDTYYGISKLAAEEELVKLGGTNFRVCIVRPPLVYGKGCPGNFQTLEYGQGNTSISLGG